MAGLETEETKTSFALPVENMAWLSYQARKEGTSAKKILNRLIVQYHSKLQRKNPKQPPIIEV